MKTLVRKSIQTPLGPMIAMAGDDGLSLLEFHDRPALPVEVEELEKRYGYSIEPGHNAVLEQIEAELADYFAGKLTGFETPLVLPGMAFQRQIWSTLHAIPYGETRTYGGIARDLGKPGSSRAVGAANGQNRVAIVVPCHRVIGADGSLTGYGGGQRRKRFLLDLEHRIFAGMAGRPVFHPVTAQGSFL
ncbi:AraC family transcriptional regulator of adaptative response/methylated-DNA-[protein]-cysteine methyltransferase [Phyllobacterium trifolii]|jgi:AraC family transcriptional regulator, regulatory protein of adaptative response / methylated-DNA-[protein]-cysteine methyltransferase|uniref:Methylated-DNA--protein-cysteine methyltransferase n=1 Tax=Phyllobacterium trifolii TaxID=300193 RepID=A0A839U6U4_9HYPH|nr:methylated-DNA--[protein]-cysteine S-methyltransferase [Phyllobacterium trifolii]MBB3145695.1 AraC family transcriptional regulator of adaptative response/methylated-DNA-[protein]-cysteine methyltransferase [Phyllobacterium trifolii]